MLIPLLSPELQAYLTGVGLGTVATVMFTTACYVAAYIIDRFRR